LPNGIRTTAPLDELKLCDPQVRLKVEFPPGATRAKREVFDPLTWFEDMRQTPQDTYSVYGLAIRAAKDLLLKHVDYKKLREVMTPDLPVSGHWRRKLQFPKKNSNEKS